jgi:nicotinate (nicotinamide) nucleotide adenylyltransferase
VTIDSSLSALSAGQRSKGVVIMGGTFDPIHHGHLRSAIDLLDKHGFKELRLVPCFQPVHKDRPNVSALQRLDMVRLSIENDSRLCVDDREITREGPSYTIDTLKTIRSEIGESEPLIMVLGTDSFLSLPTWADWWDLTEYCHIVVVARPGWDSEYISELNAFYENHRALSAIELQSAPAGKVWLETLTPLGISSSMIRNLCRQSLSIAYLLPKAVQEYIDHNQLYK